MYIYLITVASWQFHQHTAGQLCLGNRYSTEKAGGTARPSHIKSRLLGHSPPASQEDRRVGAALGQAGVCLSYWQVRGEPERLEKGVPCRLLKLRRVGYFLDWFVGFIVPLQGIFVLSWLLKLA